MDPVRAHAPPAGGAPTAARSTDLHAQFASTMAAEARVDKGKKLQALVRKTRKETVGAGGENSST